VGGDRIAVDAVLAIVEQNDYPIDWQALLKLGQDGLVGIR
jgi:hypothetical protein